MARDRSLPIGGRSEKALYSSGTRRAEGTVLRARARALVNLALALLLGACAPERSTLTRFNALPQDRFFAIDLAGTLAGRMHVQRQYDQAGRPLLRVVSQLDLPGGGRLVRRETRRYEAAPPHRLIETLLWQRGADGRVIRRAAPAPSGAPSLAAALGSVADEGSGIEQDTDGNLTAYRIGEGFLLRRTEHYVTLPDSPMQSPLTLDVSRSRLQHARINALTLRVSGPAADLLAPDAALELSAPPAPSAPLRSSIEAVISVVRERLRYEAGASAVDLEDLLATGVGDCYEFALLFEALARGAGMEAEVVTGLAWSAAAPTAFMPHAWNRVRGADGWILVDPTWGQIVQDADRIAFPAGQELDAQLALRESTLKILTIDPASGE